MHEWTFLHSVRAFWAISSVIDANARACVRFFDIYTTQRRISRISRKFLVFAAVYAVGFAVVFRVFWLFVCFCLFCLICLFCFVFLLRRSVSHLVIFSLNFFHWQRTTLILFGGGVIIVLHHKGGFFFSFFFNQNPFRSVAIRFLFSLEKDYPTAIDINYTLNATSQILVQY